MKYSFVYMCPPDQQDPPDPNKQPKKKDGDSDSLDKS